ncbi:MAG TPA: glycosyltransferase [Anaerolineales bacterium]|nr:glycosyltransferase [Anaerolineales bacterium]HLF00341.1 glycosyltransferase [Anaerolineales bacterium]
MIRVLRLIARLNIGGPAWHVTHLARELNPIRFETLLVTGQIGAGEGDMSDLARGLNWQVIPELGRAVSPLDDAITLIKLLGLIRRYRPHIVHTHTAKAGAVGRVAAGLARVPVVVHTFHGHTFRGYWGPFASRLVVAAERGLAYFTDRLVAVSDRVRDDLIEFRIAPPEKIVAIPVGLDLTPFTVGGRLRSHREPVIGIVGRLVPIKNHVLFIEMARRLIRDGLPARFMVVGDGELRSELERSAADLGDRITFAGWRRDLTEVYRELSVVVNTSLNEGTPVALIEAMAARVPVVATNVGGVPDVVRPNETGWLAPSGDADALTEGVKLALHDGQAVASRAQTEVLQRFSKERLLRDVEMLYDSLIESPDRQS